MPRRTASLQDEPSQAFINKNLFISGVFLIQQEFDTRYVIAPIEFVREMMEYTDEVTSIEIMLEKNADSKFIIGEIKNKLGSKYKIADRFQQEEMLYKIMKSEKLSIYLILTLILLIASFNIAGSVAMLIIDKKKDITLLWYLGAGGKTLRKIFLLEGMMVSFIGTLIGFVLGFVLCLLQQSYGLVKLGSREGAFAVNAYPVDMNFMDFLMVFVIVMFIGFITSWFPTRRISNKYFNQKIDYQ
jgi:lipoprotein-releasing system permease protein